MRLALLAALSLALPAVASGPQSVYEQDLHGLDERHLGTLGEGVPDGMRVRSGYRVDVVAGDLGEARFMQVGDDGTLYLSQPNAGRILSLRDADGDGTYETRQTFVEESGTNPHSMDWHDGRLWYTASNPGYLKTARDTDGDGKADDVQTIIAGGQPDGIPGGGGHAFRAVLVHGDEVGSSWSPTRAT